MSCKPFFFYRSIFFHFLVCFLVVQANISAQQIDWGSIDTSLGVTVSGKINGLNMGGYSYGYINMQGSSITKLDECVQCLDYNCSPLVSQDNSTGSEFVSMQPKIPVVVETATLKPGVLRFPGGTHSGWYHLYKYDGSGFYDAAASQIAKGYGMILGEVIHLPNPHSYCTNDSRLTVDENYIDGFVNFVKQIQDSTDNTYKIEVSYVANLLTHFNFDPVTVLCLQSCGRNSALVPMSNFNCTEKFETSYLGNEPLFNNDLNVYRFELYYKETVDAIDRIRTNLNLAATDVLYVEMGNEYYDNEGNNSGYANSKYGMNVNDYANLVEIYAERLKCFFAGKLNIKAGIISKPGRNWQNTTNTSNVNYPGLVNLLNRDATANGETLNDVVDAVILHDYYNQSDCLDTNNIDGRFNCAKEAFRTHVELSSNLDSYRDNFPGKEIWVTEWNMLGGTNAKNNNYINTPLHAAFVLEYALKLLEYNSINGNLVKMATHHRIGFDKPWSVVQTVDGDNSKAIKRTGGFAMQYLNKLYEYSNFDYLGNALSNGVSTFDTKESKTAVFFQASDATHAFDRMLIYFTNKTNTAINYTLPDSISNLAVATASISYLKGDYLFSYGASNGTQGRNTFANSGGTRNDAELDNLGFGNLHDQLSNQLDIAVDVNVQNSIPKNSIGVLEIRFTKPATINTGTDTRTACDSLQWIDGITYSASNNIATHTIVGGSANGNDSLVSLNLIIKNASTGIDTYTVCDTLLWIDGITYTASNNTAVDTLINSSGCDSIVTLYLTIIPSLFSTDIISACDSIVWIDGNTYKENNNTATHTLTSFSGCDSVVTLDLSINNNASTDVISSCEPYSWIDGNMYSASNTTATHTLTNALGCDSIITLNLSIDSVYTRTDNRSSCDPYVWIDGNTYITRNNTATHTLVNATGCDTLVSLNLTINNPDTVTHVISACDSIVWVDGITYTSNNNTATHTLTNALGCDSVVTLNLTLTPIITSVDNITACGSYLWIDGNTYTASNNTVTYTLKSAAGCDSIITLDLTINNIDTSLTVIDSTILSNELNANYKWLDCNNNFVVIINETAQNFLATSNGDYAVEVTKQGCIDTSNCISINLQTTNINTDISSSNNFIFFPNPTSGETEIVFTETVKNISVKVMNGSGQKIMENENFSGKQFAIDLPASSNGVIIIEVIQDGKTQRAKVIKQ